MTVPTMSSSGIPITRAVSVSSSKRFIPFLDDLFQHGHHQHPPAYDAQARPAYDGDPLDGGPYDAECEAVGDDDDRRCDHGCAGPPAHLLPPVGGDAVGVILLAHAFPSGSSFFRLLNSSFIMERMFIGTTSFLNTASSAGVSSAISMNRSAPFFVFIIIIIVGDAIL